MNLRTLLSAMSFVLFSGLVGAESQLKVWLPAGDRKPYDNEAPFLAAASFNSNVLGHLLRVNDSFKLEPDLLESWSFDFEDQTYQLKLRPNLKFHNGRKVTAEDLEFSLLRGFYSSKPQFFRSILANIEGSEKIDPKRGYFSGSVSGVKVIDELRLSVKLSSPNPSFLHTLSFSYFSPVPQEEIGPDYLSWKTVPIGAGPYRVVSSEPELILERVNGALNSPKRIQILTTEASLLSADVILGKKNLEPSDSYRRFSPSLFDSKKTIMFNFNHPLAKNGDFRSAIASAVDRKNLIEANPWIQLSKQWLPPHFWGRSKFEQAHDPALARKKISTLPSELKALTEQEQTCVIFFEAVDEETFDRLAAQLSAIGVRIKAHFTSQKFWEADESKTLLAITNLVMTEVDPLVEFSILGSASPFKPHVPQSDADLEKLYGNASKALTQEGRVESIEALSTYVLKENLVIPLADLKSAIWYRPERLASLGKQDGRLSLYFDHFELK